MAAISRGEDHGEAGRGTDLRDQFHRQQGDDAEGHRAAGEQYAEKLKQPDQTTAKCGGEWV